MKEKFVTDWFYASLTKVDVTTGLFFKDTHKEYGKRSVDFDSFAQLLKQKYNELDAAGYDVVNVLPIAMGQSEQCNQRDGNYVGDVGFSITRGAVLVGKRRD